MYFVTSSLFMKLFKTNDMETVRQCQQFFNFEMPSVTFTDSTVQFESLLITARRASTVYAV